MRGASNDSSSFLGWVESGLVSVNSGSRAFGSASHLLYLASEGVRFS